MSTSIGTFQFVNMSDYPQPAQLQVGIESRSGTPGVAAWRLGTKGTQFQVTTTVDTVSYAAAAALMASYAAIVGSVPQVVIVGNVTQPRPAVVLKVEPVEVAGTLLNVGGLNGTGYGICRARWTLISWV